MNKIFLRDLLKLIQNIILSLNIILLSLNIAFYNIIKIKKINAKIFNVSDYFIMNLIIKDYKDISKYLTNKFNIKKHRSFW